MAAAGRTDASDDLPAAMLHFPTEHHRDPTDATASGPRAVNKPSLIHSQNQSCFVKIPYM
jgi:hypothetical protein